MSIMLFFLILRLTFRVVTFRGPRCIVYSFVLSLSILEGADLTKSFNMDEVKAAL